MPASDPSADNTQLGTPIIKRSGAPISDAEANALEEVVVDLDSTRPSLFTLRFLITVGPGDDPGIQFNISDEIEITESSSSKTLMKGEVTSIEAEYGGGGQRFVVRGLDKSHRLHRARKYQAFTQVKDSDLVSQMAGDAGLSADATATTTVHKFIAQVNQTDWEFLKWRADENGMILDVSDDKLTFKKRTEGFPVLSLSVLDDLIAFRPRINAPFVGRVKVQAWDESTKAAFTGQASVSSSDGATISDAPDSLATKFGQVTHVSARRSAEAATDMNDLASAVAARFSDSFVDAEAVSLGSALAMPGEIVEIKDASTKFNGKYRITAAKHVFNPEFRYRTTMRFTGLEDRSLLAMTNGASPATTRVPRIEGLVPAIVTNLNDPDNRWRVKVKFPWLDDAVESDWMRVIHPGAGTSHGGTFLPEVGDEVVVGFEQGDFRRGYVLGGVYNGKDKPDTDLGTVVDNGVVKVRGYSSKLNHRLIFDDDASGKSGIHLLSGDKQFEIYLDQKNTKITIDAKSGKVEIHGAQDVSVKSDANINIEATGTLSMKGTGGVTIESSATASFKANGTMNVEGASTTVKGSGMLDLESSGIAQLKGSMVKIN